MTEAPATALDLGETARRLANVVRAGTVEDVDLAAGRARVRYADGADGEPAVTAPLPWLVPAAGEDRDWRPPSKGEQVLLLSPFGEMSAGWILPGAYRDAFPAPDSSAAKRVTRYRDGAVISYDGDAHELQAVLPAGGSVSLEAPDGVSITGDTDISGDVSITGDLTVTGEISADGDISSKSDVSDWTGDIRTMRRIYNLHTHGVPPGTVVPGPNQRMT